MCVFGLFLVLGNRYSFTLMHFCHLLVPQYNFAMMLCEHNDFALAINLLDNLAINLLHNLAINLLGTLAVNLPGTLAINLLGFLAINLLHNLVVNLLDTFILWHFKLKYFTNVIYPCFSALQCCLNIFQFFHFFIII